MKLDKSQQVSNWEGTLTATQLQYAAMDVVVACWILLILHELKNTYHMRQGMKCFLWNKKSTEEGGSEPDEDLDPPAGEEQRGVQRQRPGGAVVWKSRTDGDTRCLLLSRSKPSSDMRLHYYKHSTSGQWVQYNPEDYTEGELATVEQRSIDVVGCGWLQVAPMTGTAGFEDPHAVKRGLQHLSFTPLLLDLPDPLPPAGADGVAPVLMYTPSVHKLLPRGHPGRTTLEALLPPEGGTWLDCAPHLPADHTMAGWTLADILRALPESSKPYGHGHGFERLQTSGTQGDNVSQTWVPDNKRGSADNRVQRPLLAGQSIMEWDDASSALHHTCLSSHAPIHVMCATWRMFHVRRELLLHHPCC